MRHVLRKMIPSSVYVFVVVVVIELHFYTYRVYGLNDNNGYDGVYWYCVVCLKYTKNRS